MFFIQCSLRIERYLLHGVGLKGIGGWGLGISDKVRIINRFKVQFIINCFNDY